MSATRRLAAVLAADLVGYSRLMGLDEEGTLTRLRALRSKLLDPKIAKNGGRLVKTTGDGFLVEFNSVIDALRCASEVQTALAEQEASDSDRRFMLRIGVHQGDIVVEDGDIFGNGVNIAARLEGIAEPGGICVSERVQEDAAGRIDLVFEDIGEQHLKNIARPIRAFQVRINRPAAVPDEAPQAAAEPVDPPVASEPDAGPVASAPEPLPAPMQSGSVEPAPPDVEERPPDASGEGRQASLFPFLVAGVAPSPASTGSEAPSPQQLAALLSSWLDRKVELVQSAGAWAHLSPTERTRLSGDDAPGGPHRLGIDATIGLRTWNPTPHLVIRIGPLDSASFEALLPDQPALRQFVTLVRSVVGPTTRFAICPVLAGSAQTSLRLCDDGSPTLRLGWNTLFPKRQSSGESDEVADIEGAVFEAELVEAGDFAGLGTAAG